MVDGVSQREVARRLGCSRNTVRRYLDEEVVPGVRRPPAAPVERPAYAAVRPHVEELLRSARTTSKQRLIASRVVELLGERGVPATLRTVQRIMRDLRRERREVPIPLPYASGDLAEVDFFEVVVTVDGKDEKAFLFVMRLMYSGRDFAWLCRWQDEACFREGHRRAFEHFGAVPRRILYDNLKLAVRRILVGGERDLVEDFARMATFYNFEPRFARPKDGSDKGGVEARGQHIRLQHLSPIPEGPNLPAIADVLLARLDQRMDRARTRGGPTTATLWERERGDMLALPRAAFHPETLHPTTVDRQAQVRVAAALYSVPCAWKSIEVRVWRHADRVVIEHASERVEHVRVRANERSIRYVHYLPEFARKPQAIEQVGPQLAEELGRPFAWTWHTLVAALGRAAAARRFQVAVEAVVRSSVDAVGERLQRAIDLGVDPILALRPDAETPPAVPVPQRLAVPVARVDLCAYDALLGGVA